ncbi:hypothetical protein G8764_05230 [Pseudomaricurvus alcaniphilus]|uniref:hypothetical protein n=1 Tax=Pseudomaricurvus alcaniphilus TaxID=1166482 RepID=UPI00140CD394|nr:hypothetical protein [Pseudomaricurvus alcaniphilus]NHN36691.1 hypothetical protein [Pseudomaricurvus alcaniphilus]
MSDQRDKKSVAVEPKEAVAGSRRRFAKSGLMGGAVLMSLSGRSAFGTSYGFSQNCSVDTLYSVYNGGSQYDFDVTQCEYGCTPGFWQDPAQDAPANDAAWAKVAMLTGWTQSTPIEAVFSAISSEAYGPGFKDKNKLKGITLNGILKLNTGDAYVKQSVRHGLAAVLNSVMMGFYYSNGYSAQSIIDWFNSAWTSYLSDPTNSLYQNELDTIHTTFKSLNERSCPLGAGNATEAAKNPFFNDDFRAKINQY